MGQKAIFKQAPRAGVKTLLLIILSAVLLFLDGRNLYTQKLRYMLNTAVAPLQYIVAYPSSLIHSLRTSVTTQKALIKENQSLTAQLLMANMRSQKLLFLEKENKLLRSLLNSSQHLDVKVKAAELMEIATDKTNSELVLSQGSQEQVYLGQPVLDAHGVIGQVIDLSASTSRVMLLTDSRSALPVENNRTGLRAILVGRGDGKPLSLEHVAKTEKMQAGDVLVTSGAGHVFPQGYPVGIISSVEQSNHSNFLEVNVTPSAQLQRSRFVLLVWTDVDADNKEKLQIKAEPSSETEIIDTAKASKTTGGDHESD